MNSSPLPWPSAAAPTFLALLGSIAGAQQVQYRITDLGALGFTPSPDTEGTFGINNAGEVAYSKMVDGQRHAFVWLPRSAYGLAPGDHDLEQLFGTSGHPSIGREINDQGQIVGQIGGLLEDQGQAVVWDLTALTREPFGFLPTADWSRGMSINNAGLIVGESAGLSPCSPCGGNQTLYDTLLGFYTNSFSTLFGLPPLAGCPSVDDTASAARDIADNGVMVGFSDKWFLEGVPCPTLCSHRDAVLWVPQSPAIPLPDLGATFPSEARGVSTSGSRIVGWGFDSPCSDYNALFWEGLTAPFVLRADARAQAINNLPLAEVVGWSTSDTAFHWGMTGGSPPWVETPLIGAISSACGVCSLRQAHDINDEGWIIAWGRPASCANQPHAYVLSPFGSCPADITGPPGMGALPDGIVGINDQLALLQSWGPCPPGQYCPSDIDGDCTVGINDLLALLASWGPCGRVGAGGRFVPGAIGLNPPETKR